MTSRSNAAPGRFGLLDVVVLIAMAVIATAFAAGLIINSGIDMMAGAIAGAALFVVMASSHYVITRQARSATVAGRLDELEDALVVLDGDLQRIDQVEDDVARLDLLTDRVERLDQAISEYGGGAPATGVSGPVVERLTQDVEQLRGRLDVLRTDFAAQTRAQRDEIGAELKSLEGLIKDLSRELMAASPAFAAAATEDLTETSDLPLRLEERLERVSLAELGDQPAGDDDAIDELAADDTLAGDTVVVTEQTVVFVTDPAPVADEVVVVVPEPAEAPADIAPGDAMLRDLREAIEGNRIDLYLQPIVTLPDRKLRFYDASTRIRTGDDAFMPPGDYLELAERQHLMPRIDNVMLVKCVQLLRRLGPESRLKGVFCNLSAQSLLDHDFFPELVEFMEENSTLADNLTFQLSQRAVLDIGADELAGLKTLGKLGFVFSLDHVADLDVDFAALRDHFFRYVKIEAKTLLHDMAEARASIPAADMTSYLDRFDLKLIVEKVDDEASLERLMDYGVDLAEGDLFARPRPVTPEMFRELAEADAA
ncbi:MAG: EAL domain-containing protein [Methyloceanibacter sp.]|jgi:cyclic-di-GMP phosphodiesterase TipF (flagellum assembly factor)|uniref:EAL domain-containing protein n=1 Tax=Methyloceanibacter sp. TaxID=1965321 RepID=UPI003C75773F